MLEQLCRHGTQRDYMCQQPSPKVLPRSHMQVAQHLTRSSAQDMQEQLCRYSTQKDSWNSSNTAAAPLPAAWAWRYWMARRRRSCSASGTSRTSGTAMLCFCSQQQREGQQKDTALCCWQPLIHNAAAQLGPQLCLKNHYLCTTAQAVALQHSASRGSAPQRRLRLSASAQAGEGLHKALVLQNNLKRWLYLRHCEAEHLQHSSQYGCRQSQRYSAAREASHGETWRWSTANDIPCQPPESMEVRST